MKPNEWNVWIDWRTSATTSGCQHRPTRPKQWQSLPSCRFLARSSFYQSLDLLYPKHLTFVLSNSLPSLSQVADLGAWYIVIPFLIFLFPKHLTFVLSNSLLYPSLSQAPKPRCFVHSNSFLLLPWFYLSKLFWPKLITRSTLTWSTRL